MATAFLGTQISQHMARLGDGALLCRTVPVARDGDQVYLANELADFAGNLPQGVKVNHDGKVIVHRPTDEVFSRPTMASFEGCAVVGPSHPPRFISPENARTWACGHCQNVRGPVRLPDGNNAIVVDMVVRDPILAEQIENGTVRQVSAGYDCLYRPEQDGSYSQTQIRANHCAVLKQGRAGPHVRIYDAMPDVDAELYAKLGTTLRRAMKYPECWPLVREILEATREL